ncbi:MAG: hypothetical protein P8X39_04040 [Desulfofustis sp.]|jgi:hypothetical protein
MGRDKLAELREEWYSESEDQPETVEAEVEDEFLALNILFRSRGVTVAGEGSVKVQSEDADAEDDQSNENPSE